ncbi:MAG: DUF4276 family protein [Nitrospirae bacterium]|nr:DUF4276 family protein [Nitrospirota bacterium]
MTKKNIFFLVEGKTEALSTPWAKKGLWSILKPEIEWMRGKKIFFDTYRFNGKYAMQDNLSFRVSQLFNPPKKTVDKAKANGKPLVDYVFILRDLDCEDKEKIKKERDNDLSDYKGRYSIHFAVQEIEAWMIADLNCFNIIYKSKNKYTEIVSAIKKISYSSMPEEIGCEPKKISGLLEDIAHKYKSRYRKTIEGPQLLEVINPDVVASKCPSFADFRNDLRSHIGFPPIIPQPMSTHSTS